MICRFPPATFLKRASKAPSIAADPHAREVSGRVSPQFRPTRIARRLATSFAALTAANLAAVSLVHADDETTLREVEVVSATRGGTVSESPRSVSVTHAETLAERPAAAGIQSVLEEMPGIQFSRSGGLGGQIVMRGFNSNAQRSIITLDGDRYRGRSTLEFNMFDPDGIARIEVIRGAASAIYGADALNGVVNIVSRRAKVDPRQEFRLTPHLKSLEYASVNDMFGGRVELEGGGNGFDVLIGAHSRAASDYDTPIGHAGNSRYRSQGLDFNIGFSPETSPHRSRWELSGRYQDVNTGRAGGIGAAPGQPVMKVAEEPIREKYLRLGYTGHNYGAFADTLDASFYWREFETDIYQQNRANPAVIAMPHLKVYTPTVWGGHLTAMKGIQEHLISYGFDFFREDFAGRDRQITRVNPNTGAVVGQTNWEHIDRHSIEDSFGLFVADEWRANERLTLSGALRWDWVRARIGGAADGENAAIAAAFGDHPGMEDTAFTGNLGAVWKLTPVWSVAANLSRGFRPPSGTELTVTGTAGTINNLPAPNLKPEYNKTLELALRWNSAAHQGSLTAYVSRYTDLISNIRIDSSNFQRKNVGKAEISGLELEGRSRLASRWYLKYMLTATRGTDESANEPLAYIAPLAGRLALRYEENGWYGEGVLRGYKGKHRIDTTQERKSASYGMVDLYAGGKLEPLLGEHWRSWKVVAGVENVFDRLGRNPTVYEDIAYPYGSVANPLVEPGRNFVLKLVSEY
ncbi:MAG: TonB-dependent receptor [Zoogloeaceae bacterium]|jgi:hemoglobin/transferrin/lactoferrin receptor protein|nr:TonB-dependent receptor [Zoogloeaceae bacterium]